MKPTTPSNNSSPSISKDTPAAKRNQIFVISAHVFHQSTLPIRPIPLTVDNGLPGIALWFGKPSFPPSNSILFLCHIYTCAAMNTGNLKVHQWIMSTHPELVAEYLQYDDDNPFEPFTFEC